MFLGIDGGGTRCRARLVDGRGRILGEGLAGSANLLLGIDVAAGAIEEAAHQAFATAGLRPDAISGVRAGFGLAGANVPSYAAGLKQHSFAFQTAALVSDAISACVGAHEGEDGAILILGTGSQGVAVVGNHAHTVGGWGAALSDDASGAVLGRIAIRTALRAFEGLAEASPLTEVIMARFENSPARAADWSRTAAPRDYGHYAPLVFEHAKAGDLVATALLRDAAAHVDGMLDRLASFGATGICLMGGMAEPYRPWLAARSQNRLVAPRGDALDGALRLARQGAPQ